MARARSTRDCMRRDDVKYHQCLLSTPSQDQVKCIWYAYFRLSFPSILNKKTDTVVHMRRDEARRSETRRDDTSKLTTFSYSRCLDGSVDVALKIIIATKII